MILSRIAAPAVLVLAVCSAWPEVKRNPFRGVPVSLCVFLLGYLFASVPLFLLDRFSVLNALLLEGAALAVYAGARLFTKKGKPGKTECRWKAYRIPLALTVLALALSWGNNGYYGMDQDQGVYQVKAIDLVYGKTDRVYHFTEAEGLETPEREAFRDRTASELMGLNPRIEEFEHALVPSFLNLDRGVSRPDTDAVYHGLPTYPALLALWGTLFGIGSMAGIQTLMYLLSIWLIWGAAENLGLKPAAALLACAVYALSPQILWNSKSTLTEGALSLFISLFLYRLTDPDPEKRFRSVAAAAAFMVFHVSAYAAVHLFAALYALLYLRSGEKRWLSALGITAACFLLGFTFMLQMNPGYTLNNTKPLWIGPVNQRNAYPVLMGAGAFWLTLSFALRAVKIGDRFRRFPGTAAFRRILRIALAGLLLFSAADTARHIPRVGIGVVSTNAMVILGWVTGLTVLPVVLWTLFRRPGQELGDERGCAVVFLFFGMVLVMNCVLIRHLQHCYYFGRYLVPYLPVTCLLAGLTANRMKPRTAAVLAAVSALAVLPFDAVLLTHRDDTRGSYETLLEISETVRGENAAVIVENPGMYYLPVKAISGDACFFPEEDVRAQAETLSGTYAHVYRIAGGEEGADSGPWRLLLEKTETVSLDDGETGRIPFCPLPLSFAESQTRVAVYEYAPE